MSQIVVENLVKTFHVGLRAPGLWGRFKGLWRRERRQVQALDDVIYERWFRVFFIFVIPLATINYFPAQALLGLNDPLGSTRLIQWLSPAGGVLFLLICLQFWKFGMKHYTSTGS